MWFAALPVTFITPLSDFTIPEGDNVTFKCVTSKPEKVQWFKNGKKITKPDKRIKIKDDGAEHTLAIEKSVLDDGAEYSAKIGDQSTVGKLTVEGTHSMCSYKCMRYMCYQPCITITNYQSFFCSIHRSENINMEIRTCKYVLCSYMFLFCLSNNLDIFHIFYDRSWWSRVWCLCICTIHM